MVKWWKSSHAMWLKDILRPLKRRFLEVMGISLFANIMALVVPIFTLQVYDRVVQHNGMNTLYALLSGVIIALGFDFVLRQARSRLLQHTAIHIDARLGRLLYEKLASLPLKTLEGRPSSYWQSLFADASLIRNVFSGPTAILVADFPFVIIFIGVIMVIAWPVAWVIGLSFLLFAALTWFSSHVQDVATAKERHKSLHREGMMTELILGRATVKALMIDRVAKPDWENAHAHSIMQAYDRGSKTDSFIAMGQSLAMFTTVMMVSAGAVAIMDRDMTIGSLIAANMLSGRIIGPMNQLLTNWKNYAACKQAIHRLDRLFLLDNERLVPGIEREKPKGKLTVEKLCFHYQDDIPVLNELSFQIQPGEIIGVVGRNGSGKTTLIKCLQGLYNPSGGRILLDDGDLVQFTRHQLTSWIGYVPQECFLFDGTIRDNIIKAWPDADDESILRAAKLADADRFITELPNGYSTEIGEAGSRLSGGQRQRLAIARALLKDPPVLLFDEISSNLDNETEKLLAQTIRSMGGHRTVVMATHSLVLLSQCHKIIVMDRGKVAVSGPAKDVLDVLTGKAPPASHQNAPQGASQPRPAGKPVPVSTAKPAKTPPSPDQPKGASA